MGRKVKWFDTVQKILSSSEPEPVETTEAKAAKSRDKSSFKKLWQLTKSSNNASTSAPPGAHHPQRPAPPPSPPQPEQHHGQEIIREAQSLDTDCEQKSDRVCPTEEVAVTAAAARQEVAAGNAGTTPRALPARSKEDIVATRIQAACRGHLARRAHRETGMERLITLVDGPAVKRQTEEALYCMQTMTRVQTQICSRRLKTEEDKKALKSQFKIKQSFDKTKIGEVWDHGHQSKEQMEAVLTMKKEAASRRERALAYAFSHQWSNRNPSSARAAPPPMFMDPGNPNWGWTWTERWMAAARSWENQTTATDNGSATANSAGGRPLVAAITVQPPTTPGGRSFRPPNCPSSLPSPSIPPPRWPSMSGRTVVPVSPRSSTLHAASGLQRTKSLQPDRHPRSSQPERAVAVSSPRSVVPASPKRSGSPRGFVPASLRRSGSPLHASSSGLQHATSIQPERHPQSSQQERAVAVSSPRGVVPASPKRSSSPRGVVPAILRRSGSPIHASSSGLQRATSMQPERRPRSSQERAVSSPRHAGTTATLLPTTSLRSEFPRRLSMGGAAPAASAPEQVSAPVTPSYMQPTTSVRAKARCASPSPSSSPNKPDAPEKAPAPLRAPSPSSAKRHMSVGVADKPSPSSPSTAKEERAKRHSQPPSPRIQLI